jgi:hypothetical protein
MLFLTVAIIFLLLFFLTKKVAQKSQGCLIALRRQPVTPFLTDSKVLIDTRIHDV